jgi:hypothetical protein
MTRRSPNSDRFILEAFDRDQWCPIAQAPFHVDDISFLRALLGVAAGEDDELQRTYYLDDNELAELAGRFGVRYDRSELVSADVEFILFRSSQLIGAPYLVHTGYELPLLLDGRKKLAHISHCYPPMTFDGEDRFDHWVAKGVLHRTEIIEEPARGLLGYRTVLYTPKGEKWRIPARQLIWDAASKSGGWNDYFERLDGMLLGYEDWQNDWWIELGQQRGGFGGVTFCCPVTKAGLAWMESAGFRALPPVEGATLLIASYDFDDVDAKADLHALMFQQPDNAAIVRFNVLGRHVMDLLRQAGPWQVPADRIPELNSKLRGSVVIVARRDDVGPSDAPNAAE